MTDKSDDLINLRMTQQITHAGLVRVLLEVDLPSQGPTTARTEFNFTVTEEDQEEIRWYLEDYLQDPLEPHAQRAARVEKRMSLVGTELFIKVFGTGYETMQLWKQVEPHLDSLRLEIVSEIPEATAIPWELIRQTATSQPLALAVRSFVRGQPSPSTFTQIPPASDRLRILLVISRPSGETDVPFRSVANRIVRSLSEEGWGRFELNVLRPPTFAKLSQVLERAQADKRPYHIVHFDGHGVYMNLPADLIPAPESGTKEAPRPVVTLLTLGGHLGAHGYLVFENPDTKGNIELIDGTRMGDLLRRTDVPVLLLNACRSAHSETHVVNTHEEMDLDAPPLASLPATDDAKEFSLDSNSPTPVVVDSTQLSTRGENLHSRVHAFGSLAQEVMNAGIGGCVAMRYNIYVVTAAQFVADLYTALASGASLGEAVARARTALANHPWRELGDAPIALQDWCVPMVYETAPMILLEGESQPAPYRLSIQEGKAALGLQHSDGNLPAPPDIGFYGRDEALLAIDRAFDRQGIVLVHAYAGSGKTSTAAEFARWYSLTGGVRGPILFTSFERYVPLSRVLDQVGLTFERLLEPAGIDWASKDDTARREIALAIFSQVPVLWIWDNIEMIAGFPTGTAALWTFDERAEFVDFLRQAQTTQAKFLLTSRRDEQTLLGDLPKRITLPPMTMQERAQLLRALSIRHGHSPAGLTGWRPLLEFSGGNPMTLIVAAGQAFRDGLHTSEEIIDYVDRLRRGEISFQAETSEGQPTSLVASLSYGFEHAFSEGERRRLALLALFQGSIEVETLRLMGEPAADWCLHSIRGLTREDGLSLLDRAAEIGLLERVKRAYYTVHPAVPWFLKGLFDRYYPDVVPAGQESPPQDTRLDAIRAFVESMGYWGDEFTRIHNAGHTEVIVALQSEEMNLLHALRLGTEYSWWDVLGSMMTGLNILYRDTGRIKEWERLVAEMKPHCVDPATDGPLPGREALWSLLTDYRARLALHRRQWDEVERLQRLQVDRDRHLATLALAGGSEVLSEIERDRIINLIMSLKHLGTALREQGNLKCLSAYEEALTLCRRIGYTDGEASIAHDLGTMYKNMPAVRDLQTAERWYRHSLELHADHDDKGLSLCLSQLGAVAFARFLDALAAGAEEAELLPHLERAVHYYEQALEFDSPEDLRDLATDHHQLGSIYGALANLKGDVDSLNLSVAHFRAAIRYRETTGDLFGAANSRLNAAKVLALAGSTPNALDYAEAALNDYTTLRHVPNVLIETAQDLIVELRSLMSSQTP